MKEPSNMDFLTEEAVAFFEKASMVNRMPLEEALTHFSLLYGLTEEILRFRHEKHWMVSEDTMYITYYSPHYEQYMDTIDRRTLIVATHLLADEKLACIPASRYLKAGIDLFFKRHPEQDQFSHFVAKDATFAIDDKCFTGTIEHYTKVRYSSFSLFHGIIHLYGEMLGPSLEEFIQIVESLHDLNGKAVE